jgi:uncharacterized membrane protein
LGDWRLQRRQRSAEAEARGPRTRLERDRAASIALWLARARVVSTRTATVANPRKMALNAGRIVLFALAASSCGQPAEASCSVNAANECVDRSLSYDSGIGALLSERCSPCHAAGGVEANRLLTDYNHVAAARMSIASQLASCAMPPARAPSLSNSERDEILSWLSCGGPK